MRVGFCDDPECAVQSDLLYSLHRLFLFLHDALPISNRLLCLPTCVCVGFSKKRETSLIAFFPFMFSSSVCWRVFLDLPRVFLFPPWSNYTLCWFPKLFFTLNRYKACLFSNTWLHLSSVLCKCTMECINYVYIVLN